ncbi:MAG: hypothetical protein WDO19_03205 [Bacteroidota bacterium]
MGLTIILEDEKGQPLQTLPKELFYEELNHTNFDDFILLKYIDFYGDTVFNNLQLDDLLSDFEKIKTAIATPSETIQQIIDLIKESKKKVHTYIKFYGD